MTIPSFHFDIEERDGLFRAVCTELGEMEATAGSRDEAIQALVAKISAWATDMRARGEEIPEPLYTHQRPL